MSTQTEKQHHACHRNEPLDPRRPISLLRLINSSTSATADPARQSHWSLVDCLSACAICSLTSRFRLHRSTTNGNETMRLPHFSSLRLLLLLLLLLPSSCCLLLITAAALHDPSIVNIAWVNPLNSPSGNAINYGQFLNGTVESANQRMMG